MTARERADLLEQELRLHDSQHSDEIFKLKRTHSEEIAAFKKSHAEEIAKLKARVIELMEENEKLKAGLGPQSA